MNRVAQHLLLEDLKWVCVFIAANALLSNFMPPTVLLRRYPRLHWAYCLLVDLVATFGLNLRTSLPSLDMEFMGFRRAFRHAYRNWQQTKSDKATNQ